MQNYIKSNLRVKKRQKEKKRNKQGRYIGCKQKITDKPDQRFFLFFLPEEADFLVQRTIQKTARLFLFMAQRGN